MYYTVCYFTGIFYANLSYWLFINLFYWYLLCKFLLFIDNKDCVFCIHQVLINTANRLLSMCWYTEEHNEASVYWHIVRGRSHRSQWQNAVQSTHTKVYNRAKEHRMRLMQLFPLNLHSHGNYTHVRMKRSAGLLQRTVQCDSFGTVEDAVPHWPRSDVCRPRLARNFEQSQVALLEIHWREDSPPAQPLVVRDGLRSCTV